MVFLNKPEDFESVLVASQLQGVPLEIRIGGSAQSYSSNILAISTMGGSYCLLTKPVVPADGNKLLRIRRFVRIELSMQGEQLRTYSFNGMFLGTDTYEGLPALRFSSPERRRHVRVEPEPDQPIAIIIQLASGTVNEYVFNVSEGGVGFYSCMDPSALHEGDTLRVAFELPGGAKIESEAIVRWLQKIVPAQTVHGVACGCYCGVEFSQVDDAMRAALITYIERREQEELQDLLKDESGWDTL
jgi:c-di-GMP-binding flagellar brake protein YcgR